MKKQRSQLSAPRGLTALAVACVIFISLPLFAIVVRVPWSQFFGTIFEASSQEALWLSLHTSLITTVLAIVAGLPLAWMFAHRTFPLKNVLRTLCVLPMVLPPVVGGVALIYAFGRRGLIGSTLEDWFGYRIAFTQSATVLAQFFVAAPFLLWSWNRHLLRLMHLLLGLPAPWALAHGALCSPSISPCCGLRLLRALCSLGPVRLGNLAQPLPSQAIAQVLHKRCLWQFTVLWKAATMLP